MDGEVIDVWYVRNMKSSYSEREKETAQIPRKKRNKNGNNLHSEIEHDDDKMSIRFNLD